MPTDTTALGRFGHHPDPTIDFCVEVEEIDAIHYDVRTGIAKDKEDERNRRIARAMSFRVGGDEKAVAAKDRLRAIKREAAPPNPVAEVVERLRKAADNIERARMSGIVENLAGWEQRHARDAADLLERLSRERDGFEKQAVDIGRAYGILARERDTGVSEGFWLAPIRPTDEIMTAAAEAHFGKRRTAQSGGIDGIGMTVDGRDLSFRDAFKSFWKGARSAAPQPPTVSTQGWQQGKLSDLLTVTRERDQAREALTELQTDLSGVVDNHLDKTEGWIGRELRAKDLPTWRHKVNDILEKSRARSVLDPEKEEKA